MSSSWHMIKAAVKRSLFAPAPATLLDLSLTLEIEQELQASLAKEHATSLERAS